MEHSKLISSEISLETTSSFTFTSRIINPLNRALAETFIKYLNENNFEYFIGGSYRFGYFTKLSDFDIFISYENPSEFIPFFEELDIRRIVTDYTFEESIYFRHIGQFLNVIVQHPEFYEINKQRNAHISYALCELSEEKRNDIFKSIHFLNLTGKDVFLFLLQYFNIFTKYNEKLPEIE